MPRKKSEETQKSTTTTTRKKRTSRKPSVGLGDTIEKVTTATGIKRAVKFLAGEDCGCEERKEKLNKLFRYKKPLCLTEEEYHWLDEFKTEDSIELKKPELDKLASIWNRVFQTRKHYRPCTCNPNAWKKLIDELYAIHKTY